MGGVREVDRSWIDDDFWRRGRSLKQKPYTLSPLCSVGDKWCRLTLSEDFHSSNKKTTKFRHRKIAFQLFCLIDWNEFKAAINFTRRSHFSLEICWQRKALSEFFSHAGKRTRFFSSKGLSVDSDCFIGKAALSHEKGFFCFHFECFWPSREVSPNHNSTLAIENSDWQWTNRWEKASRLSINLKLVSSKAL